MTQVRLLGPGDHDERRSVRYVGAFLEVPTMRPQPFRPYGEDDPIPMVWDAYLKIPRPKRPDIHVEVYECSGRDGDVLEYRWKETRVMVDEGDPCDH